MTFTKDMFGEFVSEAFNIDEDEWITERVLCSSY